jgi:hypothetical protein
MQPSTYQFLKAKEGRNECDVLECNEQFTVNDTKFIVHDEAQRNYMVFDNYNHFTTWFAANPTCRTLHEVIRGTQQQKIKFDIDASAELMADIEDAPMPLPPTPYEKMGGDFELFDELFEAEYQENLAQYAIDLAAWHVCTAEKRKAQHIFDTIVKAVIDSFQEFYCEDITLADLAVSDATDATKFSRHIVLKTYSVNNNAEARLFTLFVLQHLSENVGKFVDTSVNKSIQNFRLPHCHKVNSNRIKVPIQGTADDLIITQTTATRLLPAFNIGGVKPLAPELDPGAEQTVLNLVAPYAQGHRFHSRQGNLFSYRRESASMCELCQRVHENDNTLFATVAHGCVKVHCRHAKNSLFIGRIDDSTERLKPVFGEEIKPKTYKVDAKIPVEFSVERYCEEHLREFSFHNKYDTLLIKSGMGTGKTKALIELYQKVPDDFHTYFVSFRRSFTSELSQKLGHGIVDYRKIDGAITAPRALIQFESLHRLQLPVGKNVLLVLDESESVIGQMENKQMLKTGHLLDCWNNFEWLMRNSQKVVAMDALADYRTYTLLNKSRKAVHMHLNTFTPPADKVATDYYYPTREEFLNAVLLAADTAKEAPFVLVGTAKGQADALAKQIRTRCPTANIKIYNSDSTVEERLDFEDVNTAWANVDVLIYTSTISAGCSFEGKRFTKLFAYFSANSCDYKTSIQMMGRVRDIATREYHIFIKPSGSNLPATVQEIERAVAMKAEIADIVSNPLESRKMINARGEYEYATKDLYYHLHIGNIVHRCQSQNYFKHLFQHCRQQAGVITKNKNLTLDEETATGLRSNNITLLKEITAVGNAAIAAAPEITNEQATAMRHVEGLTVEQKNSLIKNTLTNCYNVGAQSITTEFVEKYNNSKVMSVFKNLNYLRLSEESIADAVVQWRSHRSVKTTSIEDLAQSDNMLKCMFAVDIINKLMGGQQEYCREMRKFQLRYLARVTLEDNIDSVIDDMRAHVGVISLVFGLRKDRILAPRKDLKAKMELVNSILRNAYGVSINGIKETAVAPTTFKLTPPKLFQWDEGTSQYVVKSKK